MKRILCSCCLLLMLFASVEPVQACTSAVVSGKATPDGRPLLWKNRDTDFLRNHVAYVRGEKYDFIANVNSVNFLAKKEAWIGVNAAGFALMNTQSYNLMEMDDDDERGAANGRIIYRALEVCATVEEFRHFLDTVAKPSQIEANFGVIDAKGGAAMFEVDYYKYTMFDANDPKDAPYGYIARTNFSFTGKVNQGAGYVRYMEADQVLMKASATGGITPTGIFNDLSRSFHNPMLGIDLRSGDYNRPQGSGWFIDQDFISRNSTSCSVVVQGVRADEPGELTTMWTVLGYPPTSVALPLWVKGGEKGLPAVVSLDKERGAAPVSDASLKLAERIFCYKQGVETDRYLYWERLYNREQRGYMQRLAPVEVEVFKRTTPWLDGWRKRGAIDEKELQALYAGLDTLIRESYDKLFADIP